MDKFVMTPRIIERQCGGWIAISEPASTLRIGVTAESEEAARAKFAATALDWQRTLQAEAPDLSQSE